MALCWYPLRGPKTGETSLKLNLPVSKKRKLRGKTVKRQPVQMPVRDTSKQWSLKIKPSQLIYLKDDPDFLTMVKFGRAINDLSFASTVVASSMQDK